MNGILVGLCVIILKGPLTGKEGTAVKYGNGIYTVEYVVGKGIQWIKQIDIHETNVKECRGEPK